VGKTFCSPFCGGFSTEELLPVIGRMRTNGIGAILDYAAEVGVAEGAAQGPPSDQTPNPKIQTLNPEP